MRRQKLGQHYLVDPDVASRIAELAAIERTERVLEIGTGRGALTMRLAGRGASLTGYEVDQENFERTREAIRGKEARLLLADAFGAKPEFDVLVASLPYSQSAAFIRWLSPLAFSRAVVVLQEDFALKLGAPPGSRDYRGVSALAQVAFDFGIVGRVPKRSFSPQPRVNSVVVSFRPKRGVSEAEVGRILKLFSLRRRRVDSALVTLGLGERKGFGERRVYSLRPGEIHELCEAPQAQRRLYGGGSED